MVKEQGFSQERAASEVGCDQSTISRVLAKYDDTRPLARKRLEAAAIEIAERAITAGDPIKLLAKLDVVRDDAERAGSAFVAVFNMTPDNAHLFEPPSSVCPMAPRHARSRYRQAIGPPIASGLGGSPGVRVTTD